MTTTTTTKFTTRQFERTHGRKPKGFGSWAFQATTSETAFDSELTGEIQFFTGTFTEARAAAKQAFDAPLVAVLG